jgi:hypothetical protein
MKDESKRLRIDSTIQCKRFQNPVKRIAGRKRSGSGMRVAQADFADYTAERAAATRRGTRFAHVCAAWLRENLKLD